MNAATRQRVAVVAVPDGDTVVVAREDGVALRVRLHGIDAPELDQLWGPESRDVLAALVLGQTLFLDVLDRDRYGRTVGILHGGDPRQSVNKEMVERGMAYNWPRYGRLWGGNNAQIRARKKRVGLWERFGGHVRPWSHRHGGTQTPIEFMKESKGKVRDE